MFIPAGGVNSPRFENVMANFPGVEDGGDHQRGKKAAGAEKTFLVREISDKCKQREIDHDRSDHAGTIAAR